MNRITRRGFLQGAVAAGAAATAVRSAQAQQPPVAAPAAGGWKVGGFTKPLQDLSYDETARVSVEIGWDGIECAVRAAGHVLPERVDEDLPRMVAATKARGLDMLVLATDVKAANEPLTEKVLRAAARANVRLYRLGALRYRENVSIARQLDEFRAQLKDLAALNRQLGVTGLLQNHSGNGYVGAPIWDIYDLVKDIDPKQLGIHFDIGHATVENGLSWPTAFALVKDHVGGVIVKDFAWKFTPGRGSTTEWCPIGKGTVSPRFFTMLKASPFRGPITAQFEYAFENNSLEAKIRALKADHQQVREWIKA